MARVPRISDSTVLGSKQNIFIIPSKAWEQFRRRDGKDVKTEFGETCSKKTSSGHDAPVLFMNSLHLWLLAQDWAWQHFIIDGEGVHEALSLQMKLSTVNTNWKRRVSYLISC